MKKIYKKLIAISLALGALIAVRVQAATQETLTVVCVIGSDMVVRLDQNLLLAEVDTSVIGTTGTDTYFLGGIQVGLYNNHSSGTDTLKISSPDADGTSFRTVKNDGSGKYVYLTVKTDHDSTGKKLVTPTAISAGGTIRTYTGSSGKIIENEVHNHTYYATDNANNSTTSGVYEASIIYSWTSA